MFEEAELPISLLSNLSLINHISEIDGLYAKDHILRGQIAMKEQLKGLRKLIRIIQKRN